MGNSVIKMVNDILLSSVHSSSSDSSCNCKQNSSYTCFLTLPPEIHLLIFNFLTPPYSLRSGRLESPKFNPLPNNSLVSLFYLLYALARRSLRGSRMLKKPWRTETDALHWMAFEENSPRSTARVHELYLNLTHTLLAQTFRTQLRLASRIKPIIERPIPATELSQFVRTCLSRTIANIPDIQLQISEDSANPLDIWLMKDVVEVEFWQGFWTVWDDGITIEETDEAMKYTRELEAMLERELVKRRMKGLVKLMVERRIRRDAVDRDVDDETIWNEVEKLLQVDAE